MNSKQQKMRSLLSRRIKFSFTLASISLLIFASVTQSAPVKTQQPLGNPQFEQLIDRYLAEFHGLGGKVARVNDGSAAFYEGRLEAMRLLLKDLQQIERKTLTFEQDIDFRFLEGLLKSRVMAEEKIKRWQQDPRQYLSMEPIISPRGGLLYDEIRPLQERATQILAIMRSIPSRLENGKKNLVSFIPLWLGPSLGFLDGDLEIFEKDLPRFADRLPEMREELVSENKKVIEALRDFRNFLERELPKLPSGDWRVGEEVLNSCLRNLHMIDEIDCNGLYNWGRREYQEQLRVLERAAINTNSGRTWQQIEWDLQADHPSAESFIYEYLKTIRRCRDWLVEKDLVSIPWDKENAAIASAMPSVYGKLATFGYGGAPVGIGVSAPGGVTLVPFDPSWSSARQEEFLRGHKYALIHVMMPHEVYPGHGLVQLYDNHNPRKLRTFESSYTNQAWCYYVEWALTPEHGFFPAEKYGEYMVEMERNKLWRYARVIYDLGMHTGKVSFEEAAQLMQDGVLFSEQSALNEVEQTTRGIFGGTAVATWGYHEVLKLRDDYFTLKSRLGEKGTLKDFHDRILKIGMLPVKLARETLFHQLSEDAGKGKSQIP